MNVTGIMTLAHSEHDALCIFTLYLRENERRAISIQVENEIFLMTQNRVSRANSLRKGIFRSLIFNYTTA